MNGPAWWQELKRRNVVRVGIAYVVMGWVVAQAGQLAFETFAAPEWVGKVLLTLIALGLPIALFFAWAFELTPEGIKTTREADADTSITRRTGRKVDYAIMAALVVAVLFLGWDKLSGTGQPAPAVATQPADAGDTVEPAGDGGTDPASIAVLPFVNMSADPEQEFFSDGISEELLNLLARIPKLKVAARTSSFAFKGRNEPIGDIAETLNVAKVLEGSVRKSGTRLRITAQLIEADTGYHLWSDTYDRELDDVFAIQDEIAAAIVVALRQTLGLTESAPLAARTQNIEAYSAFLEGRELMEQRGQGPLEQAQVMLEKAIQLDPEFAPAYSSLAEAVLLLPGYSSGRPMSEALERARPLVDRALELAPDSPDSLVAYGFSLDMDRRVEEAIEVYDRVLEINPNMVRALMWRARCLEDIGRHAEGMDSLRKAITLDPLGFVPVFNTAEMLQQRGQFEEAVAVMQKLVSVRPSALSYRGLAAIYRMQGKYDAAHAQLLKAREIAPDDRAVDLELHYVYSSLVMPEYFQPNSPVLEAWKLSREGRWNEAAAILEERLAALPDDSVGTVAGFAASANLRAGNPRRALEIYRRFLERSDETIGRVLDADDAFRVIHARRLTGDNSGAEALLKKLRVYQDALADAGYADPSSSVREARILALEGQPAAAMSKLREAVDQGFADGNLLAEWEFKSLHGDPEFQQINADWERILDYHRAAIRKQLGEAPAEEA